MTDLPEQQPHLELLAELEDAALLVNRQGQVEWLNQAAEQLLGFPQEVLLGQNLHNAIHHSHADGSPYPGKECPFLESYFESSRIHRQLEILWRADGTSFPAHCETFPLAERNQLLVILRDAGARFQLDRLLSTLLDNTNDYLYFKDRDGRFMAVSQPVADLVGRSSWRDLIGLRDRDVFPLRIARITEQQDQQVIQSGQPLLNIIDDADLGDGIPRRFSSRKYPLRDESGQVIGIFGFSRDLTAEHRAILQLRRSEESFQGLVETIPGVVYRSVLDEHWTMLFLSDHIEHLIGYPAADFVHNKKRTFASVIHPEDRERVAQEVIQAVEAGQPFTLEYRLVHRNGSVITVLEQGRAQGTDPDTLVGTILDISERKRAAARFQAMLEAAPDAMVVCDTEARILLVNQKTERMFGYPRTELEGLPVTRLMPERLRQSYWEESLSQAAELRHGGKVQPNRVLGLRSDGVEIPMEAILNTLELEGREVLVCNLRDISDREAMEARFRAVFEYAHDAFLLIDHEGRFVEGNPAVCELYQVESVSAFLNDFGRFSPPFQPDGRRSSLAARELLNRASTGERQQFEWVHRKADGTDFPCEVILLPVKIAGESMVLATVHDLSIHKQIEQELQRAREFAEQASRAKSEFLANMSHEIRTPLHAILGMGHLLSQTELNTQQQGYSDNIQQSADALLGIVNDILDFSKIEAGYMELEQTVFRLDDVLAQLTAVVGSRAHDKGLSFDIDLDESVPQQLVGDSLRLSQILTNLAGNAVKFTESGSIQVRARVLKRAGDDLTLEFEVEDSGIGMTPDQTQRLFQSFSQADSSTTRRYGGTGLGLVISQRLVQLMGGQIDVESAPGRGSTFRFGIRLKVAAAEQLAQDQLQKVLAGRRALVVENTTNAALLNLLRRLHLSVEFEVTPAAALARLNSAENNGHPYDLLVLNLPLTDTLDTLRWLKSVSLKHPPSRLILTDQPQHLELKEQVDPASILSRPVAPSALLDALMQIWGEHLQPSDVTAAESRDESVDLTGKRVLLAEDNALNQKLAEELLRRKGIVVVTVENGQEALERAMAEPFDLVLMDVQMPVMDGLEATRRIRDRSELAELPIVAMTANAMARDREECYAAGMDDYLGKPIEIRRLYQTLQHWLAPASDEAPIRKVLAPDHLREDPELYSEILNAFVAEQSDAGRRIAAALQTEDYELAARLAHTLKGLAATIGARNLARAAANLEQRLMDGTAHLRWAGELQELQTTLQSVLQAAEEMAGDPAPPAEDS